MTRILFFIAFLLGAAAVVWMAAIFAGSDMLALTVTLVIGGVYILGGIELWYFRAATSSLQRGLDQLPEKLEELNPWLSTLSPALRNATQARIEAGGMGLPTPVLTPYLVGLLVMLGLLGTFVGMVETLQGAVMALEGNNELQAIRAGLAAPIEGLGLAFGTSVAGVSASAMLGLMSTLSRRERLLETRRLDQHIATSLRGFSLNYSRQQTYKALQLQADTLPAVAERLDGLASTLEMMSARVGQDLVQNQQTMQDSVKDLFVGLASSVEKSLSDTVAENSRLTAESGKLIGASVEPIMQQAVDAIQAELGRHNEKSQAQLLQQANQSYEQLEQAAQQTLQQLSRSAESTQQALTQASGQTQEHISQTCEQQLQSINERFNGTAEAVSSAWAEGLRAQQQANKELLQQSDDSLKGFSREFKQLSADLLQSAKNHNAEWLSQQQGSEQERLAQWQDSIAEGQQKATQQSLEQANNFKQQLEQQAESQQRALAELLERFESVANNLSGQWQQTGDSHSAQQQQLAQALQQSAQDIGNNWQQTSNQMLEQITGLLSASEALQQQRMQSESEWLGEHRQRMQELASMLGDQLQQLRQEEQQRGDSSVARLSELEQAVAGHLADLGQSLEEPMGRLIATASEAPKAAAEVIEHLRGEISKNIERDNGLLSERRDVLVELNSLSGSIQQTATAQQQAIELLVSASTDKLQAIGEQFNQQVREESGKLTEMVGLFAGSSAELSSLGEAFTVAVEMFRESNAEMVEKLNQIENALSEAGSRSDEQLGYYVAQAREIIDQSVASQQQMLDGLRQLREAEATA